MHRHTRIDILRQQVFSVIETAPGNISLHQCLLWVGPWFHITEIGDDKGEVGYPLSRKRMAVLLFYLVFKMALIKGQFVKLFNAFLLNARRASPLSAWRVAALSESNTLLAK